jgi:GAF domain-containing protein
LESLVHLVESQSPDVLGSMLLLDADGVRLSHRAAPSLPLEFVTAIDGLSVGPHVGACGAAAYRREPVTVVDIASDPLWTDHRALAVAHGLRSCLSTPILSASGDVFGVFAIYSSAPRMPTDSEARLAHLASRLAAISLEQERAVRKAA